MHYSYLVNLANETIDSLCDSLNTTKDNTLALIDNLHGQYHPHFLRTSFNKHSGDFSIVFDYIYHHQEFEIFVSDSFVSIFFYSLSPSQEIEVFSKAFLIKDSSFKDSLSFINSSNFNSLSIPLAKKLFSYNINPNNIANFLPIPIFPIELIASSLNSLFFSFDNNLDIIPLFNLNKSPLHE